MERIFGGWGCRRREGIDASESESESAVDDGASAVGYREVSTDVQDDESVPAGLGSAAKKRTAPG